MRVLHFIYDDPGNPWVAGGGAVRVFELYRRLGADVDAEIVTGAYPGAANGPVDGVRYRRVGARGPYALSRASYAAAANRILRSEPYDAAVFDFSSYTPIFVPRDRPVGITVHHLTAPTAAERWGRVGGLAVGRLERAMLRRARRFSATSTATRDALREIVGPDASIELVYAGVPDELFDLPHDGEGGLLYFGRLDVFQKGIDTLIQAFALVARDRSALRLRVAGRGKDAARVTELAASAGVADRVEMLGAVSELERQRLFREATLLVMPSRFEGFGMVAAEAMAAGVPVVAAAAGSLPEVVDSPRGGLLVEVSDPGALARAITDLLDDPAARVALSRSARESAERFRWDAVAANHLQFLRRIVGSATARRTH